MRFAASFNAGGGRLRRNGSLSLATVVEPPDPVFAGHSRDVFAKGSQNLKLFRNRRHILRRHHAEIYNGQNVRQGPVIQTLLLPLPT